MSSSPSPAHRPATVDLAARTIDLSMPIEEHWRFSPRISYAQKDVAGCAFHSTAVTMGAHGFTHVDAPLHVDPSASALSPGDIDSLRGVARVIDVSALGSDVEIGVSDIEHVDVGEGDIVLIRSRHEERHPTTTPDYWVRSPWMGRDAVEWLAARGIGAVGFDFPQDRGIRSEYVDDWVAGEVLDDWPCHKLLLTRGIFQIEYLTNLAAIEDGACLFFAVPLNFSRSDGSPVRAFALPLENL